LENSAVSQLKTLYGYADKTSKLLEEIANYIDERLKEIEEASEEDEVNAFLKELAKNDLEKLYFFIKSKVDFINTPIRAQKKGFKKQFNQKIDEMIDVLLSVKRYLENIIKKIDDFQKKIQSKRTGFEPFKDFILDYRKEIHENLNLAVKRILQDKVNLFREELDKIKTLKTPNQIFIFLKTFEQNINTFIKEQLLESIAGVMYSLKDTMAKKTEVYLERLDIPEDKKKKILEEVKVFLDNYENVYPVIYFDIPDIPKDFFDYKGVYQSKLDVFVDNITSIRFIAMFLGGVFITFVGLIELYITENDMFYMVLFLGMIIIIFALLDAFLFNHSFLENFLEERKEQVLELLKPKVEEIKTKALIFLLEQEENLENAIDGLINEELEIYSKGGKYLEDMKDTFNSFINRIENLKLELERAKQS
jgi:hypothetical protein